MADSTHPVQSETQFAMGLLRTGALVVVFSIGFSLLAVHTAMQFGSTITEFEAYAMAGIVPLIAASVSVAFIAREQLRSFRLLQINYKLAHHDELTGLHNRRAFFRKSGPMLADILRAHQNAAVLVADIDNFKQINDTYGHACGDEAIMFVARQLQRSVSPDALVARIGGEEYALLIPVPGRIGIFEQCERLLRSISDQPFVVNGHHLPITISIGACLVRESSDVSKLLSLADAALYTSKSNGKNCFSLAA